MKKLVTLLATLVAAISLSVAQDSTATKKVYWNQSVRDELFTTNSQIRLATGVPTAAFMSKPSFIDPISPEFFLTNETANYYLYLDLSYGYRVWDFLEVVGALSIVTSEPVKFYAHYSTTNEKTLYKTSNFYDYVFISALARYSWYNRKWVSLYSSLGVTLAIENDYTTMEATGERIYYGAEYTIYPDVVPFGIRVGRKFFGYLEPLNFSVRSVALTLGLGYRF